MSQSNGMQNTQQGTDSELADGSNSTQENVQMTDKRTDSVDMTDNLGMTDSDMNPAGRVHLSTEVSDELYTNNVLMAHQTNIEENRVTLQGNENQVSVDNCHGLIHDGTSITNTLDPNKAEDNECDTHGLSHSSVDVKEESACVKQLSNSMEEEQGHSDSLVIPNSLNPEKTVSDSEFRIGDHDMHLKRDCSGDGNVLCSANDGYSVVEKINSAHAHSPDGQVLCADNPGGAVKCGESDTLTHGDTYEESSNMCAETLQIGVQDSRQHVPQTLDGTESLIVDQDIAMPSDHSYNLNVDCVPKLHCESKNEFELGQRGMQNFLRGCKWSPDGTCLVTNSDDNKLRLFYLTDQQDMDMRPSVVMKEGSQIYDFAWLPQGSCQDSQSHRVACSSSGVPVHLWDATKGKVEASYKAFDQYDEITAAYSLCFSMDGKKLYTGYDKAVRIFDVDCPQRSCRLIKTYDSSRKTGQRGIISCFAMSPDDSGLFVAGSYSRQIGIYDTKSHRLVSMLEGQFGGITHVMYSPDGSKLYSGGRKDSEILCWDVRNTSKILYVLIRDVQTHQRMYFDFSKSGRWITAGNHDGSVFFWDTCVPPEEEKGEVFLKPQAVFQAHLDCVNGVSFNPVYDVVATASGQRHFQSFATADSDSSGAEDMDTQDTAGDSRDFSLRLWMIDVVSQS